MGQELSNWLEGLGLGQHAEAFARNGVDFALVPELTNEDLKDLGIAGLADRKRLLKAIADLAPAPTSIDASVCRLPSMRRNGAS